MFSLSSFWCYNICIACRIVAPFSCISPKTGEWSLRIICTTWIIVQSGTNWESTMWLRICLVVIISRQSKGWYICFFLLIYICLYWIWFGLLSLGFSSCIDRPCIGGSIKFLLLLIVLKKLFIRISYSLSIMCALL